MAHAEANDGTIFRLSKAPSPSATTSTTRSPLARDEVVTAASSVSSLSPGRPSSYSRNVPFTLLFSLLDGSFYSMWAMQLLPVFLLNTTSSITAVSFLASVCGVAQLLGALVVGCIADRQPRQRCIRTGAVCAVVSLALFVCAFWTASMWLILCAQALWGLYTGIISTSVEALFADSVPQGQRTSIYNVKWVIQTVSYIGGYGVAALLFFVWGNSWSPQRVRVVMTLGVVVHPLALVPLCWLQDRYSVREENEGILRSNSPRNSVAAGTAKQAPTAVVATVSDANLEPCVYSALQSVTQQPADAATVLAAGSTHIAVSDVFRDGTHIRFTVALPFCAATETLRRESCDDDAGGVQECTAMVAHTAVREGLLSAPAKGSRSSKQPQQQSSSITIREDGEGVLRVCDMFSSLRHSCWRGLTSLRSVPYWMSLVDLLLAIGSGMSLPYFPLFFASECNVSPVGLNAIYIASTMLTAATSSCLPWLINNCGLGRVPTALGVRLVGTVALFVLATARRQSTATTLPGIIALFLCRNALMNSVLGITRSVIMDCVTKDSRAKWSALESVSLVSWTGSAMLGGYITKQHGYRRNFVVTAVLQFSAALLMIPAALGARALDAPLNNQSQLVEDVMLTVSPTAPSYTVKEARGRRQ
ncbi:putative Major Facilitator Superfamily/Sugar transporter [Leishmania shawi]|uniref:Major Facilitator Superfamily/Sugar transporter n=1 Tax=Leishmania shawi TaxID=5680 RepID=A0AAW3C4C2_9TRYP